MRLTEDERAPMWRQAPVAVVITSDPTDLRPVAAHTRPRITIRTTT